jgi:hypothetical protein
MALKKVSKSVNLKAVADQNVFLTITIGNAQIGGSVVRFKNSPTIIGKGEIKNLSLGLGSGLIGKVLKVTTNVLDVNQQTNGIVVTYFFHNCAPVVIVFNDTVNSDGDILSYLVDFNFK